MPAAGKGIRMGGSSPKQYLPLHQGRVIDHALVAVCNHPACAGAMVVLAADDDQFRRSAPPVGVILLTTVGGTSRSRSVLNGLQALRERCPDEQWVLIHDAVRPLLPVADLHALLQTDGPDGAILALPLTDTLKQARGGRVARTLDRTALWRALTPQKFQLGRLADAIAACHRQGVEPTDDCAAMEAAGYAPLLVAGSSRNFKITEPEDLSLAAALLAPADGAP